MAQPANISITSKKEVLLKSLTKFFREKNYIDQMLPIISGYSKISLRVLDWFATNYAKKINVIYPIIINNEMVQFNVHLDYKSQLKAFNKKFFDPFCRKNRIPFKYADDTLECFCGSDWVSIGTIKYPPGKNNKNWVPSFRKVGNKTQVELNNKWIDVGPWDKMCPPEYQINEKIIVTTIGQLNFFRWAIRNKILDHVNEHLEEITKDMNMNNNKKTRKYKSQLLEKSITIGSEKKKRKERHELSTSATKTLNKHDVKITLKFQI